MSKAAAFAVGGLCQPIPSTGHITHHPVRGYQSIIAESRVRVDHGDVLYGHERRISPSATSLSLKLLWAAAEKCLLPCIELLSKEVRMKKFGFLLMLLAACLSTSAAAALEVIAEARIESATGAPVQEEVRFRGQGYDGFVLKVENGAADGSSRVSSAVISLNGVKVLGPADFSQKVSLLQRSIAPNDQENVLSVNLRSKPGSHLLVQVLGEPLLDLPPDPGPAGDDTIAGVDVNQNGVRDDIERWIGLNFRDSEKTRMALTQAYYPLQNFMLHARDNDRDAVYNDMDALQRAGECLDYIRPDDGYKLIEELKARVVNTSTRSYAYLESSRILGGGSFPSAPFSKWNQSCTFNPDVLED